MQGIEAVVRTTGWVALAFSACYLIAVGLRVLKRPSIRAAQAFLAPLGVALPAAALAGYLPCPWSGHVGYALFAASVALFIAGARASADIEVP